MVSIDRCTLAYSLIILGGMSDTSSSLGMMLFLLTVFPFIAGTSGRNIFLAMHTSLFVKGLFPVTLCSIALARSRSLGHASDPRRSLTFAALQQSIAEKCALSPLTV